MKSTLKLIRRFVLILILSVIILLVLNLILFLTISTRHLNNATVGGWEAAQIVGQELSEDEKGVWVLSEAGKETLLQRDAWAILIEDKTGNVIWHSDNLPEGIPMHYSAADISWYTRGYIEDYPTTTAARGEDLVILGHPKDRYWKHLWNTFDYHLIANIPKYLLLAAAANFVIILLIYMIASSGILRSVKPIVKGIEALPKGEDVYIQEKGLLSGLSESINRTSEKLRLQERALKKKESARANWISGVSHDIRTPLSMVMGYAGQLESDTTLSKENQKKAGMIRQQSVRMKNLVNDLNLASKLEYNMQPMKKEPINLVAAVRQAVADFMNFDLDEKYSLEWKCDERMTSCVIEGDKALIQRAISNVITNVQVHNPEGCRITVMVARNADKAHIIIEDDGVGVTEEQLEKLCTAPHYMLNDSSTAEQRHGLGLLIVKQIAAVHQGAVFFDHGREQKGFTVKISFPIPEDFCV